MARTVTTPQLFALVRAQGVVSERALVDAVAGAPVRGSWWGHPRSHEIFRALEQLRDEPDVFLCKLLDGKQTYVHRRLWPALLRVQAEASAWPALSAAARRLLSEVERRGGMEATGRLRLELETALRVVARALHTSSGAHAVVLTPFESHFSEEDRAAAGRLSLDEARAALGLWGPPRRPGEKEKAPPRGRKSTPRRRTGR